MPQNRQIIFVVSAAESYLSMRLDKQFWYRLKVIVALTSDVLDKPYFRFSEKEDARQLICNLVGNGFMCHLVSLLGEALPYTLFADSKLPKQCIIMLLTLLSNAITFLMNESNGSDSSSSCAGSESSSTSSCSDPSDSESGCLDIDDIDLYTDVDSRGSFLLSEIVEACEWIYAHNSLSSIAKQSLLLQFKSEQDDVLPDLPPVLLQGQLESFDFLNNELAFALEHEIVKSSPLSFASLFGPDFQGRKFICQLLVLITQSMEIIVSGNDSGMDRSASSSEKDILELCIRLAVDIVGFKADWDLFVELFCPDENCSVKPLHELLMSPCEFIRISAYNCLVRLNSVQNFEDDLSVSIADYLVKLIFPTILPSCTSSVPVELELDECCALVLELLPGCNSIKCGVFSVEERLRPYDPNNWNIVRAVQEIITRLRACDVAIEFSDRYLIPTNAQTKSSELNAIDSRIRGQLQLLHALIQFHVSTNEKENDTHLVAFAQEHDMPLDSAIKFYFGVEMLLLETILGNILFPHFNVDFPNAKSGKLIRAMNPMATTTGTRKIAFDLLHALIKDCNRNAEIVLSLVSKHHVLILMPYDGTVTRHMDAVAEFNNLDKKVGLIPPSALAANAPLIRGAIGGSDPGSALSHTSQFAYHVLRCRSQSTLRTHNGGCYVGVDNPGCVCYMISCLQQLFMIPQFRERILKVPNKILNCVADDASLSDSDFDTIANCDDILHQTQLLFSFLQESVKRSTDISRFCYSFKNYENKPTDVMLQQDASEFLTVYFQQIESKLKGGVEQDLVKNIFGGTCCNQLRATVETTEESVDSLSTPMKLSLDIDEPFFFISIPVAGLEGLLPSLAAFTAPETVDYTWKTKTNCGATRKQNIPTSKRTLIKNLPESLVFHLKRFDFNFETMQHVKINDRFEFPFTLDMFEYTLLGSKGVMDDDVKCVGDRNLLVEHCRMGFVYELGGVIVHAGSANSGHYYSFARQRKGSDCWYEFNDSYVREFDADADIEMRAFGRGSLRDDVNQCNFNFRLLPNKPRFASVHNAFMLFYDRVNLNESSSLTECAKIPLKMCMAVHRDNYEYWMFKFVYDGEFYIKFIHKAILCSRVVEDGGISSNHNKMIREVYYSHTGYYFVINFVFGTLLQLCRCSTTSNEESKEILKFWLRELATLNLMSNSTGNYYYSVCLLLCLCEPATSSRIGDERFLPSLLIQMDTLELRELITGVLSSAISSLGAVTERALGRPVNASTAIIGNCSGGFANVSLHEKVPFLNIDSALLVCGGYVSLIAVKCIYKNLRAIQRYHFKKLDTYFKPLSAFISCSSLATIWCLQEWNLLGKLLSFFMGAETRFPELLGGDEAADDKSRSMIYLSDNNDPVAADATGLLECISMLLQYSAFSVSEEGSINTLGYVIDSTEIQMLDCPVFVKRLVHQIASPMNGYHYVKRILEKLVWDCTNRSVMVANVLLQLLFETVDCIELKKAFRAILIVLGVDDSLHMCRVSVKLDVPNDQLVLLGKTLRIMKHNSCFIHVTDVSIEMLFRIIKHNRDVYKSFMNSVDEFDWIERYLGIRKQGMVPTMFQMDKPTSWLYADYISDLREQLKASSTEPSKPNMVCAMWQTSLDSEGLDNVKGSGSNVVKLLYGAKGYTPYNCFSSFQTNPFTDSFNKPENVLVAITELKLKGDENGKRACALPPSMDALYDSDDDPEDLIGRGVCITSHASPENNVSSSFDGIIRGIKSDGSYEVVLDKDNCSHTLDLKKCKWEFID